MLLIHAFLCATSCGLLLKRHVFLFGAVSDILTEERLRQAYGVEVRIISTTDSRGGTIKACVPLFKYLFQRSEQRRGACIEICGSTFCFYL
jgi:ABC-type cobalamin/Fe3+-siderophores transport system ATPase subunit